VTTAPSDLTGNLLSIAELVNRLAIDSKQFARRRADPRFPFESPATLGVGGCDESAFRGRYPVHTLDISYQGVGFVVEPRLELGSQWMIQFPIGSAKLCVIPVRIVHVREWLPRTFRIGSIFEVG